MDRTGAAQGHAAAELGARHAELIAQHPKQGHIVGNGNFLGLAVDLELCHGEILG
ncbi:hypothetical protein D3C72_2390570 [compost metagenome]